MITYQATRASKDNLGSVSAFCPNSTSAPIFLFCWEFVMLRSGLMVRIISSRSIRFRIHSECHMLVLLNENFEESDENSRTPSPDQLIENTAVSFVEFASLTVILGWRNPTRLNVHLPSLASPVANDPQRFAHFKVAKGSLESSPTSSDSRSPVWFHCKCV